MTRSERAESWQVEMTSAVMGWLVVVKWKASKRLVVWIRLGASRHVVVWDVGLMMDRSGVRLDSRTGRTRDVVDKYEAWQVVRMLARSSLAGRDSTRRKESARSERTPMRRDLARACRTGWRSPAMT